jgi:hypothetical protein
MLLIMFWLVPRYYVLLGFFRLSYALLLNCFNFNSSRNWIRTSWKVFLQPFLTPTSFCNSGVYVFIVIIEDFINYRFINRNYFNSFFSKLCCFSLFVSHGKPPIPLLRLVQFYH